MIKQRRGEVKGLKKLRHYTDRKGPQYECSNCGCKRYSPCGCQKGVAKPL